VKLLVMDSEPLRIALNSFAPLRKYVRTIVVKHLWRMVLVSESFFCVLVDRCILVFIRVQVSVSYATAVPTLTFGHSDRFALPCFALA
jgi:hypothetical protein